MAKKSDKARPYLSTKKHLARQEKERRQTRIILIATAAVMIFAIAAVLFGVLYYGVVQPKQPVAIVNEENISTADWQTQTRYYRYTLIRSIENTLQLAALLGDDPNSLQTISNQIQAPMAQLEPLVAGQATLDQMIDDVLIRHEANGRGISVSEKDINSEFQAAFGFYPDGTPTQTETLEPLPTSTLSLIQKTLIPVTPTDVIIETATPEGVDPTPTEITTPTPSPTPYTLKGYESYYRETINSIGDAYDLSKSDIKEGLVYSIEAQLYRQKLADDMFSDLSCTEHQVWARHILVEDKETADEILVRLDNGDDFCELAPEYSSDTSNKDQCGDLGWFGEGRMVAEFEQAAYALEVGEISEPVETQFGWHIIQSLGNEERQLSEFECEQLKLEGFNKWLIEERTSADIEVMDYWVERVPEEPTLPIQTQMILNQLFQSQIVPPAQP